MRPLTELCLLAKKHESDKGGRHLRYGGDGCHATHEHTPIYWDLMNKQRQMVKSVLEIGVNRGCGLRMWADFFPNAHVVGFDNERSTLDLKPTQHPLRTGQLVTTQYADQSDAASLTHALAMVGAGPYDLIVDDGSHLMTHQATSMKVLLPHLSDIGVYVIEDIPVDQTWHEYLLKAVPEGYHCGVVYPALGVGEAWPESLFIVTRE